MRLFNLHVRLDNDPLNTVYKQGLTPAEIAVLHHIHGTGSVVGIHEAGKGEDTDERTELARLRYKYARRVDRVNEVRTENSGRLPMDIHDLELDPTQFKNGKVPTRRGRPPAPETEPALEA